MYGYLSLKTIKRLFQLRCMVTSLTGVTPSVKDLLECIVLSVELDKLEEAFCSSEDNIL